MLDAMFNFIRLFFQILDFLFFNWAFCFVPNMLKVMSLTIASYTIGNVLDLKKKRSWKIALYVFVFIYSMYSMGLLSNLLAGFEWDALEWSSLIFGVIAPICMVIVGKYITSLRVRTHKIFNYYVWLMLYLLICTIWWLFAPNEVYYGFVFVFLAILLFIKWYYNKKYGVVPKKMSEKNKNRVGHRILNVVYFGIGFPLMWWVIQTSLINLNDEIFIENFYIGIIGLVISSILYIAPSEISFIFCPKKFYFFCIGFFLSWFLADFDDFLITVGEMLSSAYI